MPGGCRRAAGSIRLGAGVDAASTERGQLAPARTRDHTGGRFPPMFWGERSLRWHVLAHSVASFFYNTVVLAVGVDILTGR